MTYMAISKQNSLYHGEYEIYNLIVASLLIFNTSKIKEGNSIQFNSVYLPIKGPQEATGKLYIDGY